MRYAGLELLCEQNIVVIQVIFALVQPQLLVQEKNEGETVRSVPMLCRMFCDGTLLYGHSASPQTFALLSSHIQQ